MVDCEDGWIYDVLRLVKDVMFVKYWRAEKYVVKSIEVITRGGNKWVKCDVSRLWRV